MNFADLIPAIGAAAVAIVLVIARIYIKASKYEAVIKALSLALYPLVKAVSEHTQNKVDDQVAAFLKALNDGLAEAGLPPVDELKARELFKKLDAGA